MRHPTRSPWSRHTIVAVNVFWDTYFPSKFPIHSNDINKSCLHLRLLQTVQCMITGIRICLNQQYRIIHIKRPVRLCKSFLAGAYWDVEKQRKRSLLTIAINSAPYKVWLLESKMAPRIFVCILLRARVRNNWFQVENLLFIIIEKKPCVGAYKGKGA